jgi:hypothetical protein
VHQNGMCTQVYKFCLFLLYQKANQKNVIYIEQKAFSQVFFLCLPIGVLTDLFLSGSGRVWHFDDPMRTLLTNPSKTIVQKTLFYLLQKWKVFICKNYILKNHEIKRDFGWKELEKKKIVNWRQKPRNLYKISKLKNGAWWSVNMGCCLLLWWKIKIWHPGKNKVFKCQGWRSCSVQQYNNMIYSGKFYVKVSSEHNTYFSNNLIDSKQK